MTQIKGYLKELTMKLRISAPNLEELPAAVYKKAVAEKRLRTNRERKKVISCTIDNRLAQNWANLLGCPGDFSIGRNNENLRSRLEELNDDNARPGPSQTSRTMFEKTSDAISFLHQHGIFFVTEKDVDIEIYAQKILEIIIKY